MWLTSCTSADAICASCKQALPAAAATCIAHQGDDMACMHVFTLMLCRLQPTCVLTSNRGASDACVLSHGAGLAGGHLTASTPPCQLVKMV